MILVQSKMKLACVYKEGDCIFFGSCFDIEIELTDLLLDRRPLKSCKGFGKAMAR